MMGVKGKLTRPAYKGFQKVCRLADLAGEDIYITCIAEGTHSMPSRHYFGMTTGESDAWDMRPLKKCRIEAVAQALGFDFDVVNEVNHWHIEYDPR